MRVGSKVVTTISLALFVSSSIKLVAAVVKAICLPLADSVGCTDLSLDAHHRVLFDMILILSLSLS